MTTSTYQTIAGLLVERFSVPADKVDATTTLEALGLDSLSLMEFVFAVEDAFDLRISEEQLDPRQAGTTLEHLCSVIETAKAATPA